MLTNDAHDAADGAMEATFALVKADEARIRRETIDQVLCVMGLGCKAGVTLSEMFVLIEKLRGLSINEVAAEMRDSFRALAEEATDAKRNG